MFKYFKKKIVNDRKCMQFTILIIERYINKLEREIRRYGKY